jgi:hypothetical protein
VGVPPACGGEAGALGEQLHRLSKEGAWAEMTELVDDEVVETFCVIAPTPQAAGAEIVARYGDLIDRVQIGFQPDAPQDSAALLGATRRDAPSLS